MTEVQCVFFWEVIKGVYFERYSLVRRVGKIKVYTAMQICFSCSGSGFYLDYYQTADVCSRCEGQGLEYV